MQWLKVPAGVVLGTMVVPVSGGVLEGPGLVDSAAVLEVAAGVVGVATGDVLASSGVEVLATVDVDSVCGVE